MKINIVILFFLLLGGFSFSQQTHELASVRPNNQSTVPSYIQFKEDQKITLESAFDWLKTTYKLSENVSFSLVSTISDKLGMNHQRYQQLYNGIIVKDAIWIIHLKDNNVVSMNGLLFANDFNSTFQLSETIALSNALDFVGAEKYKWEVDGEENHLKNIANNPDATNFPTAQKVYLRMDDKVKPRFVAAYKFTIYAHSKLYKADVYVDANTGEISKEENLIHDANVVGTAHTGYCGVQSITTDSYNGSYRLRETARGNGINTYNLQQDTEYGNAIDFVDTDNNWNNVNSSLDQYATDVHFGSEKTYDYYFQEHNRNSIDGNGFAINSYVHYDYEFFNAFWDGYQMTYGDGDIGLPLTTPDIVGHEITHGLTQHTAGLIYASESGALNESFSDIFGTAIEKFTRPSNWDWIVASELGGFRSMSNPNAYQNPDTYLGTYWDPAEEVHNNSSIQNYWFYLLVNGGTGVNDNSDAYSVSGIGFDQAEDIAYRNLTVYLTPASNFEDARFYSTVSASDLFGVCTSQVEATTNAWYAVGVGDVYSPVTIAQFNTSQTISCSAPFTVNFQNLSTNGETYLWNFGDGQTSTSLSPSHVYNSNGTFTVTLTADGGVCGNDVFIMNNHITINPSLPCNYTLVNFTNQISSACQGTVADSGGENNNYNNQEYSAFTIQPVGAQSITLNFVDFDLEEGYDFLIIYDGLNSSAPLMDYYTNGNPPPPTINSSGGSIYLEFYSDESFNYSGFLINWQCSLPSQIPSASFSASETESCVGNISFYDASLYSPTSWLWNFGDGQTSTQQNPIHYYAAPGYYNVNLSATNSFGTDTHVSSNYIHIFNCASVSEFKQNQFIVYPNPASDKLFWKTSDETISLIEITDITGRIIHSKAINSGTKEISLSTVTSEGTYFIVAKDSQGIILGKSRFVKTN